MKTTKIFLQAKNSNSEETLKRSTTGKGLKYFLILFMLSWIAFLPSCAVAVRTPEPAISVETRHHRLFHRNHYRQSHIEYRYQDDHHR